MILRFDTSLSNLVSMQIDKINKGLMFVVQEDKGGVLVGMDWGDVAL